MKSSIALASLLSLSAIAPTLAFAEPGGLNIVITCPATNGNQNVLTNFGEYIAGYGQETIEGVGGMPVYFRSFASNFSNLPTKLTNYRNEGVTYVSTTGQVNCNYVSQSPNKEPAFDVSYTLTNGKGGSVTRQAPNSITIRLPVGLKG